MFDKLSVNIIVHILMSCEICGVNGHVAMNCQVGILTSQIEKLNHVNNLLWGISYSSTCNTRWRNHPNFLYKNPSLNTPSQWLFEPTILLMIVHAKAPKKKTDILYGTCLNPLSVLQKSLGKTDMSCRPNSFFHPIGTHNVEMKLH